MKRFKKQEPNVQQIPGEYMYVNPNPRPKGGWWKSKTTVGKVSFILSMVMLFVSIVFGVLMLFARDIFGNDFADTIYGADIPNGFVFLWNLLKGNSLRLLYSFVVVVVAFILAFTLDIIIKMCSRGSKKANTTGSILRSLIKYASVIIGIGVILYIWGVNVAGIVASVGVLTLVIGLGCQSLISDIVSGLFIVFDDYFDVGDMVIIDGFRGYVEEIGLRTVKLNDNCGNVKSITNSSINTCVNLSRHPNYISITLDASYFEDVERLEGIFATELPKIKDAMPQIIDGPFYKGIGGFTKAGVSYTFACTCRAEYRFQVARDFKREIYQMFVRNNIIVPFEQLVINQPDPKDRPKASEDELKAGKKVLQNNRKLKEPKPRRSIRKVFENAVDDTAKEFSKK